MKTVLYLVYNKSGGAYREAHEFAKHSEFKVIIKTRQEFIGVNTLLKFCRTSARTMHTYDDVIVSGLQTGLLISIFYRGKYYCRLENPISYTLESVGTFKKLLLRLLLSTKLSNQIEFLTIISDSQQYSIKPISILKEYLRHFQNPKKIKFYTVARNANQKRLDLLNDLLMQSSEFYGQSFMCDVITNSHNSDYNLEELNYLNYVNFTPAAEAQYLKDKDYSLIMVSDYEGYGLVIADALKHKKRIILRSFQSSSFIFSGFENTHILPFEENLISDYFIFAIGHANDLCKRLTPSQQFASLHNNSLL